MDHEFLKPRCTTNRAAKLLGVLRFSASVLVAIPVMGTSALHAQEETNDFLFVSLDLKYRDIPQELARLYVSLFNTGRLSLQRNVMVDAANIEEVLRKKSLLYGPSFPIQLDALACDLNSHVCNRLRIAAKPITKLGHLVALSEFVAGTVPTRGNWDKITNVPLVLPDIAITPFKNWVLYSKAATQDLSNIVVTELHGCKDFDEACKTSIRDANPKRGDEIFGASYAGRLALPAFAVRAPVNIASFLAVQGQLLPLVEERPKGAPPVILYPIAPNAQSYKMAVPEQRLVPTAEVLSELRGTLVAGTRIRPQSGGPEIISPSDFAARRLELEKLIKLPYPTIGGYKYAKSKVAVFDGWVDPSHCGLSPKERFVVRNMPNAPKHADSPAHCDQARKVDKYKDHGTLVVGVLAGRHKDDLSWGINPHAEVYSWEVKLDKQLTSAELGELQDLILSLDRIFVVNMSLGYVVDGDAPDLVEYAISNWREKILFVAAAGNGGNDNSIMCSTRPACFDLPNVVSVAALNRDMDRPALPIHGRKLGSNYGQRAHLGAIGEAVFSTARNGRYGYISGTSAAAPQVAAVASIMVGKYPKAFPEAIKNRLIYCSDHIDLLQEKLFGGRLNAECAIDGDTARLSLKDQPTVVSKGKVYFTSERLRLKHVHTGWVLELPMESVRALHYDKGNQAYIVFYNKEGSNHNSKLIRETHMGLMENSEWVFKPNVGSAVKVAVNNIYRYISPMK